MYRRVVVKSQWEHPNLTFSEFLENVRIDSRNGKQQIGCRDIVGDDISTAKNVRLSYHLWISREHKTIIHSSIEIEGKNVYFYTAQLGSLSRPFRVLRSSISAKISAENDTLGKAVCTSRWRKAIVGQ